jgi:hypothetical protein
MVAEKYTGEITEVDGSVVMRWDKDDDAQVAAAAEMFAAMSATSVLTVPVDGETVFTNKFDPAAELIVKTAPRLVGG